MIDVKLLDVNTAADDVPLPFTVADGVQIDPRSGRRRHRRGGGDRISRGLQFCQLRSALRASAADVRFQFGFVSRPLTHHPAHRYGFHSFQRSLSLDNPRRKRVLHCA